MIRFRNLEIAGKRERGRPKMTWKDMQRKKAGRLGWMKEMHKIERSGELV